MIKTASYLSDDKLPTTDYKRIVRIRKPTSNSSLEIRKIILRDEFGYTPGEIRAFNDTYPNNFFVNHNNKVAWATIDEVRTWKPGRDGLIPIKLTDDWVLGVINFRRICAEMEIYKVGNFISNGAIKDEFIKDLKIIFSSSGQTRINALHSLMATISGDRLSGSELNRALKYLTNESGYKDNPFLLIALAQTVVYRSSTKPFVGSNNSHGMMTPYWASYSSVFEYVFRPSYNAEPQLREAENQYQNKARSLITNAILATNAELYTNHRLTKAEAAMINRYAGNMYYFARAAFDANHCNWIARYQSMSPEERDSYKDGDVIELIAPGQTQTPLSVNEEKLADVEEKRQKALREDNKMDAIGSELPPTDHRTSEYFQKSKDTYTTMEYDINNKKRSDQKGYKPKLKGVVSKEQKPYTRANFWADGYGAVFGLYVEAVKWRKFHLRMDAITRYIHEKERLENAIKAERVRLKPPPPEITLKHIEEFRRYGRITADPSQRQRIISTLDQLYILLEEGQAFYN